MELIAKGSVEAQRIDEALRQWRQGDLALDERWFVHVGDGSAPLSDAAADVEQAGVQALTSEVLGLVVVTQTCDVIKPCLSRPYVEVAPLMQVSADELQRVKRGRYPSQVTLPSLESERLVADLARTMTVEKSIVATWKRTPGCTTDSDARRFAEALARKRARFAFPDDFNELVKALQNRLMGKHDRNSVEGRVLRALREIRVSAAPSWDSTPCTLTFWFVRNGSDVSFEGKSWDELLDSWMKLVPESGRFAKVYGQITTLDDLTASDYVDSDRLDLDHLSSRDSP